jgi:pyroglutamyl-peptidase
MNEPKVLVAGFGSWAKAQANPARDIALTLGARTWGGCEVIGVELPVDTTNIASEIDRLLIQHSPDAWIGVGMSSAAVVEAEMVGINWRDFDVPDVGGKKIGRSAIIEDGPAAYFATLPNYECVDAIRSAGVPSEVSFHAGTHLCNQMLYTTSHLIKARGMRTLAGFIHVPRTPATLFELDDSRMSKPSMNLAQSCEAVARCVETTAHALAAACEENV